MEMTIHTAEHALGDPTNVLYPNKHVVNDAASLAEAVSHDYVGATFRDNRRKTENFISSDSLIMDIDNDNSDDPSEYVTPDDVARAFPGVEFAIHYSTHHNLDKGDKSARPRFHVFFPIASITDADEYAALKRRIYRAYPVFDANALDAARCFAGTPNPEVEWYDGIMTIAEFLGPDDTDDDAQIGAGVPNPVADIGPSSSALIPLGCRNSTLSQFAGKVLKRLGPTTEAREAFDLKAALCDPPLPDAEVETIWSSALGFYAKISSSPSYVPPHQYTGGVTATSGGATTGGGATVSSVSFKPDDETDLGQAAALARCYADRLCYCEALGFMVYYDGRWQRSETRARAFAQELTDQQMQEASETILDEMAKKKPNVGVIEAAKAYLAYARKRRSSSCISACLKEAPSKVAVPLETFDADAYLINTPAGTYDLRKGLAGLREHRPADYITNMTAASPSDDGAELWHDFLETVFCGDEELIRFVQLEMGQMLVGRVYEEALIIAYGSGRNGKSTLFNTVARVLNTYGGKVSAAVLTTGAHKTNVMQELAAARGKRLLIASEMTEGSRLDDGTLKLLCATDTIWARYLYKEPFQFVPSHTTVLYTNHCPKVGSIDEGTWRRLIVLPFNARIEGANDVKNYADFLFEHAGGAILAWLIKGAKMAIELGFRIEKPKAVLDAIEAYRDANDWLKHFVGDCCVVSDGDDCTVSALSLYQAYRNYSLDNKEYVRRPADFYAAIETAGYKPKTVDRRKYFTGLRLRTDEDETVLLGADGPALNIVAMPSVSDGGHDDFADFLA